MVLNDAVRQALTAGHLAHLVTLNPDGSPQVTLIWVGLDGDEIVSAHLGIYKKIRNIQKNPHVVLSLETGGRSGVLDNYLVIEGKARVTEGGAPELLRRLAQVYIGPDAGFPPDDAPDGYIIHITPESMRGVGPWQTQG
jgi:PPOX class probable F420-dependent enzyme